MGWKELGYEGLQIMDNLTYQRIIKKVYKGRRYIPTLSNDGHHVSTYILRDKVTGRFVSRNILNKDVK